MSSFFVNRPIVAMVISIITVMLGVVAMQGLPIAQYPEIVPPMIQVTTTFIGASATDVEASVATPLEQQLNGVEKGIYMKSTNANDGTLTLKVSFEVGSNQDMDNVFTQNRVSQALPQMPQSVKNYGVTVKKALAFPLLVVSVKSPKGTYDSNFLSNYATLNINDPIARIPGVGQINLFGGSDYAMRVWLRPDRIGRLGITIPDIVNAINQQNQLTPAGQIGGPPAASGTEYTYTVRTQGRLLDESQFGNIILRTNPDGSEVRLKDVARLELGTMLYNAVGRHDGTPAAVIAIFQIPGTNAVQVADSIKATLADLKSRFPRDMEYLISLDTTLPVTEGINEIVHTLLEAVVLVIIVVFIFLQNWRATLIPLMTVPVSLVGAFIFFPLLGFSINVLSLLGLVLAIGIVVDDAIVVVEAVMHHIEHGLAPKEATIKAMEEVSGPVVAIGLVLSAVFVPVGFMGGITGRLYQQFAITIAISVLLSVINALTLSPALAALLLKPTSGKKSLLTPFYNWFNRVFGRSTDAYVTFSALLIRKWVFSLGFMGVIMFVIVVLTRHIPGGFVPEEDQGYIMVNAQLPDAASLERTDAVMKKAEAILEKNEAVEGFNTISGYSLITAAYSSNMGFFFVQLKPWHERHTPESHSSGVVAALNRAFQQTIPEAAVFAFGPPAIPGLGTGAGFTFELQDRSGGAPSYLAEQAQKFIEAARKRPEIGRIATLYRASVPQVFADIDRSKVLKSGVLLNDVNTTLGALLGSSYVNDFNRFGRVYKVYVQAEAEFREDPKQLGLFFVRNSTGRDGAARYDGHDQAGVRARIHQSLQSLPRRGADRRASRRLLLGGGARRARGDGAGSAAARHELRLGGHVLSGAEGARGRRGVRPRGLPRVPDSGGAVRELGTAVQRAPRHAVRRRRRVFRPLAPAAVLTELRQQRVRADRSHHADRSRRQERDPHRRVREGGAREWPAARRVGAQGRQTSPETDSDDGVCLHPRRRAAAHGRGRRGRGPQGHGRGRVLRNADRDDPRRLPRADALRSRREDHRRPQGAQAGHDSGTGRGASPWQPLTCRRSAGLAVRWSSARQRSSPAARVGPNYKRPEMPAPAQYRFAEGPAQAESMADLKWWQVFDDPALQALIQQAIANNLDLRGRRGPRRRSTRARRDFQVVPVSGSQRRGRVQRQAGDEHARVGGESGCQQCQSERDGRVPALVGAGSVWPPPAAERSGVRDGARERAGPPWRHGHPRRRSGDRLLPPARTRRATPDLTRDAPVERRDDRVFP